MRILASFLLMNALAFGQTLTEFGAVTAGSAVGGASGKSVSNGINAIFGKVDRQTAKAAAKETKIDKEPQAEALKVAPGAPAADPGGVPLPPPAPAKRSATRAAPCRAIRRARRNRSNQFVGRRGPRPAASAGHDARRFAERVFGHDPRGRPQLRRAFLENHHV